MKILFLTTAHNGLSQRASIELTDLGHDVTIELALSPTVMCEAVRLAHPDLIVAPMLKQAIPETIWRHHTCLVVHPGIRGDRGPSSLDWAIQERASTWGVTILQAAAEMNTGDIWAWRTFPLRAASKASIYRREVSDAAVEALIEAVQRFETRTHRPEPLDYTRPDVTGRLRPSMKQADRHIDWQRDPSDRIIALIHAADGAPGVLDVVDSDEVYLYGAHVEDILTGPPGSIIAQRDGAICRATVDGAVWITHVKRANQAQSTFKLPATLVLNDRLTKVPVLPLAPEAIVEGRTYREIRYDEDGAVGYLHFDCYNGAMGSEQCHRIRDALRYAKGRPTRVIVLMGGSEFWSNGIHLNLIEAAHSPAAESWRNIHAMDDLVQEVLETDNHVLISALQGNAGAGGVPLALAADEVWARTGVVLNPHYRSMGGLYGSEYWTYILPRRVGRETAMQMTNSCLPIGTRQATAIGLIDDAFGTSVPAFVTQVRERAQALAADPTFHTRLVTKCKRRWQDSLQKPLSHYRQEELTHMEANFFGPDPSYHLARHHFVIKQTPTETPGYLALHRASVKPVVTPQQPMTTIAIPHIQPAGTTSLPTRPTSVLPPVAGTDGHLVAVRTAASIPGPPA